MRPQLARRGTRRHATRRSGIGRTARPRCGQRARSRAPAGVRAARPLLLSSARGPGRRARGRRACVSAVRTVYIEGPTVSLFALVMAAFAACGRALGTHGAKIAGCLCASYIGGSLNFAATAQALDVVNAGGKALLTGAMAADNLAMCAYLAALFAIKTSGPSEEERSREVESGERVLSGVTAASACASLAMALIVLELSRLVAAGFGAPSLSLGVACVLAPIVSISASTIARTSKSESRNLSSILAFSGSQPMSEALMLLFFATLGAMVDLRTIFATLSGGAMLPFIAILLTTQLVFTLLVGHKLLKIPLWAVLVAANANVGGPATAAAMAAARGWRQAFAPAVATGIFGYSIATLIGVAIGNFLA